MEDKIVTSKQYSLDWRDFLKGLFVSVMTSVLVIIENSISAGQFKFNWREIGIVALGSAVAYLIKNYFTPSTVKTPVEKT